MLNMPRKVRKQSKSGVYHIMIRGINQQRIFEDEEDFEKLLLTLIDTKAISEFKIFAYCLMSNHFHLLIKEGKESLEQIFKRLGARYVYWYNMKYKRTGHLFQDRFKSEPIEDDSHLLTVLRYIHQNPQKANLCEELEEYKWSSYREYIGGKSRLIDTEFVFEIFDIYKFIEFNKQETDVKFLENEEKHYRLSDDEAKDIIKNISKCENTFEFQELDLLIRKNFIKRFKEKGLSIRQISRLTGVSKGIVEKI